MPVQQCTVFNTAVKLTRSRPVASIILEVTVVPSYTDTHCPPTPNHWETHIGDKSDQSLKYVGIYSSTWLSSIALSFVFLAIVTASTTRFIKSAPIYSLSRKQRRESLHPTVRFEPVYYVYLPLELLHPALLFESVHYVYLPPELYMSRAASSTSPPCVSSCSTSRVSSRRKSPPRLPLPDLHNRCFPPPTLRCHTPSPSHRSA